MFLSHFSLQEVIIRHLLVLTKSFNLWLSNYWGKHEKVSPMKRLAADQSIKTNRYNLYFGSFFKYNKKQAMECEEDING